jgi:hypothetical protein
VADRAVPASPTLERFYAVDSSAAPVIEAVCFKRSLAKEEGTLKETFER